MGTETLHSIDVWRSALSFDPNTGIFRWRIRPSIGVAAGDIAGSVNVHGYVAIKFKGATCKAHRLAWLFTHGEWPKCQIDHINRDRSDNRIENLREATFSQNNMNKIGWNKLGIKGVWRAGRSRAFSASIQVGGKLLYLGSFPEPAYAQAAYRIAAAALFGEFARTA